MARIDLLGSKEATIFEGEKDMMEMKVKPKWRIKEEKKYIF